MIQPNTSDVLDALIIGGGPAGTAAAFRARELGLRTLVIDFDDILKRIRDYPKDKLILPDFGGGDKQAFPAGGECIQALQFGPIDKDDMCAQWKGMYEQFGVPYQTGIELSSMNRVGDVWRVNTWDHKKGEQAIFQAKHVVIALGRGVPRRFDIPGNVDGVAYRLDDPQRYLNGPVLVVGGGTSAAEAVLAISKAKIDANEQCNVYWSYRGTKMPRVSKALAEQFFEAYIGNGNIRHYPESEPVAVITAPDRTEYLSLRVDRKTPDGRPPETVHLEFKKTACIACIGEDIPEALLQSIGIYMVPSGPQGKKTMAVTPLLESQQPNVYVIGDLLSQSYLETDDFKASVDTYRPVKHRGNIKTSLRDGVMVAEVIKQRLEGKQNIQVTIEPATPTLTPVEERIATLTQTRTREEDAEPPTLPPPREAAYLVVVTPTGVEAEEFSLKASGTTTLGKVDRDITFATDTMLSDAHASILARDGEYFVRDDGSVSGTYLRVREKGVKLRDGDLFRAGRQILVVSHKVRGEAPQLEHYNASGQQVGTYDLKGTIVFGRSGGPQNPDVVLDAKDNTLSRFHFSVAIEADGILLQDFNSKNGTYLKIDAERKLNHGDIIRVGAQQLSVRLREDLPEKTGSIPVPKVSTPVGGEVTGVEAAPPPPPELQPPSKAAPAPAGPQVTVSGQNIAGPIDPSQTLLEWADDKNVTMDYECWAGMCGCDAIRVVSGAEFLNPVTDKEIKTLKRKGLEPGPCRLACMTRVSGPVVVEVITD